MRLKVYKCTKWYVSIYFDLSSSEFASVQRFHHDQDRKRHEATRHPVRPLCIKVVVEVITRQFKSAFTSALLRPCYGLVDYVYFDKLTSMITEELTIRASRKPFVQQYAIYISFTVRFYRVDSRHIPCKSSETCTVFESSPCATAKLLRRRTTEGA